MIISNSPDISNLTVNIIYDISGTTPIIYLENLSQGDNLSGVSYAFTVISPTLTYITEGNIESPNIIGEWSEFTISANWPRPFNTIEWSGNSYQFFITIKDSQGNIYTSPIQLAIICRPPGNLPTSKNTYGVASVLVQVKCEQGRIYFQDTTNSTYKGLTGTLGSSVLRVNFPMDETGTVPDPFIGANFSSALVPVTYSGKGYQFLATSIYQYELSENTFVRIKYLKSDTFGVWCNIDLMPLLCEYEKLINSIENGTCSNAEEANRKLMLINPKFSMVVMGMFQPLIGIDVPALIEEIKLIGGFDCDCCSAASGIVPTNSSVIDGYNFSVVTTGGDVGGSFVPNGNNIQLLLNDVSYIFKICDGSPAETTAFTVVPSVSGDGFTKTYCLNVDVAQFAEDMLTVISTDAALVNLFNSIVLSAGEGNFQLIVDGGCIFSSSQSCDYTFSMNPIPASTTFAILAYIQTDQQTYNLNHAFNLTSLPALQTALNALGIGTFVVTNAGGGTVVITSTGNINNILAVGYKNPLLSVATMTKDCVGYTPLSANEVVQNIINYLCDIDESQITTSQAYEICYIDPETGVKETATVNEGVALSAFILELLSRGCDTINYVVSLGAVNCVSMRAAFPSLPTAMGANDVFLNTRGGECSQINPLEAFYTMLTYGINNADVKAAFCAMATECAGGLPCAAYDVFFATIDGGSPVGDDIDLIVTFSHPDAISHTIRYARIDNTTTPTYITIPGLTPGDSPYTINVSPSLQNGQYRVYIRPIYADGRLCSESVFDTPACTGINSFSAAYDGTNIIITYNVESSVPSVRVNITYPNGGSSSSIHTNGDAISIAPPPNVFGTFFATLQPVCNVNTGFFGSPSSQALFSITEDQTVLIEVVNPTGGSSNRITNVTGISGFIFGSTINEGETQTGSHDNFTGAISVAIVQPSDGGNNGVALYVNGILVECLSVTGSSGFAQTKAFASRTYASTDVIRITYDEGICDSSPAGALILSNLATDGRITELLENFSYTIVSGSFPIEPGDPDIEGTHGSVVDGISVTIFAYVNPSSLRLYKNTVLQECLAVMANGIYDFAAVAFDSSDTIEITFEDGTCS